MASVIAGGCGGIIVVGGPASEQWCRHCHCCSIISGAPWLAGGGGVMACQDGAICGGRDGVIVGVMMVSSQLHPELLERGHMTQHIITHDVPSRRACCLRFLGIVTHDTYCIVHIASHHDAPAA